MRWCLCLVVAVAACSIDEARPFGSDATGGGARTGGASAGGASATGGGGGMPGTGGVLGTGGAATGGTAMGGRNSGGAGGMGGAEPGAGGAPACVLPALSTMPCAAELASIGATCRDYVGTDGAPVARDCTAANRAPLGSCLATYMDHPWHCVAACPMNLCQ